MVHTFPKGICPKVNVIARLEYELAYYDSAVHRFNHYTTRTPPAFAFSTEIITNTETCIIHQNEIGLLSIISLLRNIVTLSP